MHRDVTELIIKSYFKIYNTLGHGHLENVYKRALEVAFKEKRLRCEREMAFPVFYHGENVGDYRADNVVQNCVIVEVKTASKIDEAHLAQCVNYLKASKMHVALLLNFGPKAQFERVFLSHP